MKLLSLEGRAARGKLASTGVHMPENLPGPTPARFGPFELDPHSGELRKHGIRVRLAEQPFRLLAFLIERAGNVVTREELRQHLWPEDTFVDFDNGLNAAVNRVREALADSTKKPRYIETLPKRGYRFIASLEVDPAHAHTGAPEASSVMDSNVKIVRRVILWAGASLGVAILAVLGIWARHALAPTHAVESKGRVMLAVLPFVNLSGDPSQEYFSESLTEEMTTQLGGLDPERLGIIARTSALQYKGTHEDTRQIGRDLNVDYLLEGSVRREGGHVRVTAQLIQVRDQSHVWAADFDRDLSDILALQSEVAGAIAEQVHLKLTPERSARLREFRHVNAQAFEDYLQGRYFWNKRTPEGYEKGIEFFTKAITLDPSYAPAYTGLADAYALLGSAVNDVLPRREAMTRAREAAKKALSLDDSLAAAHASLGFVEMHYDWNFSAAENEFLRAIALDPDYATAHHWYAYDLVALGRADDAMVQVRLAHKADPLSVIINHDLGEILMFAGRDQEAIEQFQKTLEMDPTFGLAHWTLAWCYRRQNQPKQFVEELEKAGASVSAAAPGIVYAATGRKKEARRVLAEVQQAARKRYGSGTALAALYIFLGDKDHAFGVLENAFQERAGGLIVMRFDPVWEPLRSDPRFTDLERRVGLLR